MDVEKILFKLGHLEKKKQENNENTIRIQRAPLWRAVLVLPMISLTSFSFNLGISILTFGKSELFYVKDNNNKIVHTSIVIPKCLKFPFLQDNDYQIGPCWTKDDMRGQGIYPVVLRYIASHVGDDFSNFFMIVRKNNAASISGVKKAGFVVCGSVQSHGVFKIYY